MNIQSTSYGSFIYGDTVSIFEKQASILHESMTQKECTIGLSGGSTPQAFYKWCQNRNQFKDTFRTAHWFTSDERMVPMDSVESNFGNADRMLLTPYDVSAQYKHPWSTEANPQLVASAMNAYWNQMFSDTHCFDVCLLGLGDDGHIASIFPSSDLLDSTKCTEDFFAAVLVSEKGMRFTITLSGLMACKQIVVLVTGKAKQTVIQSILHDEYNPQKLPAQILKLMASKVTWLVESI